MNISNLRDSDYETKQEVRANVESKIVVAKPNLTTSSWSRLKDPRIVRVSRAFGGKDRHSKVCTVRGLRDRRVRLSVQTAIQLYDLQDRLGLNQPSKVVDWLLDAAKTEIDELPPLQIPPGNFGQNLQAMLNASSSHHQSAKTTNTTTNGLNWEDYWNPDKSKAIARETSENCEREHEQEQDDSRNKHDNNYHGTFFQSNNFFGRNMMTNSSNLTGLLNNVDPNSSHLLKWDPSNLSLSQFGSNNVDHNFNMSMAALPSIPSGSQVLLYPPPPPPPLQTQSYFPSHNNNSDELNFQTASSSSSSKFTQPLYAINQGGMRAFHLSMNPKFFSSEDNDGTGAHEPNK